MVLDKTDGADDNGALHLSVSCSICLDHVTDTGDRSFAKLLCGHQFHLDCIGSAFNIKGAMQCPNCRKIEKGQWLYATPSSCRTFADFFEDWLPPGEELYDINNSEMFGVQWCPFGPLPAFSRLPSFEEGEFPSTAYQDFLGQHGVYAEHTAISSSTHQCPYVAYYGPPHSSSSNSVVSVTDGPNFSNRWGGSLGLSELQTSFPFPSMEAQYHGWEHHSMPFSGSSSRFGASDQPSAPSGNQRSSRANADLSRPGPYGFPVVMGHSSDGRAGSSVTSSMVPPYPGSAARARDRAQAFQAYFQQPSTPPPMRTPFPMINGTRRSNHSGASQLGPLPSSSDQGSGFYLFPSATPNQNFTEGDNQTRFHGRERDHLSSFSQPSSWWP